MPSIVLASAALALSIQAQAASRHSPGRVPGIVETPADPRGPGIAERRRAPRVPHIEVTDSTFSGDLRKARREIDRRRRNGELSAREARELRREMATIGRLADRYRQDGFSGPELRELDVHAQAFRSQVLVRAARPSSPQS